MARCLWCFLTEQALATIMPRRRAFGHTVDNDKEPLVRWRGNRH